MKLTLADFIAMNIRPFPDRQAIEVLGAAPGAAARLLVSARALRRDRRHVGAVGSLG